jgi:hemerythrin
MVDLDYIRKSFLGRGVYYIEVDDIDLRILCGAPCNVSKIITQNGFSDKVEYNNQTLEKGPNAILLSDFDIQNQQLCNASEFPILHMLYKQHRIDFDNLKESAKPILIGRKEILDNQKKYIFLGNYGFTNKEQFLEYGFDEEFIKQHLQLKNKFAFGKIRDTKEFLRCVELDGKTKIKNDLHITRKTPNIFELTYKNCTKSIDLNLYEKDLYKIPYNLDFTINKKNYFSVINTGNGDGWNTKESCASSLLSCDGSLFMVDSPPNIDYILYKLNMSVNDIKAIFMTHCHDDHFIGLVKYLKRGTPVCVYAINIINGQIKEKLSLVSGFNIKDIEKSIKFIDLKLNVWSKIDNLEVKPIMSPHPIETTIFDFKMMDKSGEYKTYGHYMDIISLSSLKLFNTEDKFLTNIKNEYTKKLDLKKIDVGGGIIHGNVDDFKDDKTDKIIYSHLTNVDLHNKSSKVRKFGNCDILINKEIDYLSRDTLDFLNLYTNRQNPIDISEIKDLKFETIKPNVKLYPSSDSYFLISKGSLKKESFDKNQSVIFNAGSLIKYDTDIPYTYFGFGYAVVTKIKIDFLQYHIDFYEFNIISDLIDKIVMNNFFKFIPIKAFDLFELAKSIKFVKPKNNTSFRLTKNRLCFVINGKIKFSNSSNPISKDCFVLGDGEISVQQEDVVLFHVDLKKINHIPFVNFKLQELRTRDNLIENEK